jgi:hypothetical protein
MSTKSISLDSYAKNLFNNIIFMTYILYFIDQNNDQSNFLIYVRGDRGSRSISIEVNDPKVRGCSILISWSTDTSVQLHAASNMECLLELRIAIWEDE